MTHVPTDRSRRSAASIPTAFHAAGCIFAAAQAGATTVTLDLNRLTAGIFASPIELDGFYLTPAGGGSSTPAIVDVGGTNTIQSSAVSAQGADVLLSMVGGGAFTLGSVQVAAVNGDNGAYGIYVVNTATITEFAYGKYARGDLIRGETRGGGLISTFTTEDYSSVSAFMGATQFDLDPINGGDEDAITAIAVSYTETPEPASITLLGFGLAAFATARARRKRIS